MRRSTDNYNCQNGWETTSQDYHSQFTKMEGFPTDVPQYPNAHLTFNKKVTYEEEDGGNRHHHHHHHHYEPRVHRKVQFVEETTETNQDGITREVYGKKTIDEEADSFIQEQKRKNFELYKSDTYKMY